MVVDWPPQRLRQLRQQRRLPYGKHLLDIQLFLLDIQLF